MNTHHHHTQYMSWRLREEAAHVSFLQQCELSIHWRFQTLSSWSGPQGQRRLEAAHPRSTSGTSHQALIGTPPNLGQTGMERRKNKASSEILLLLFGSEVLNGA